MDEEEGERMSSSEKALDRLSWVWGGKPPIPETRQICPEYQASFFSRLTFEWMSPIMVTGYRRPLEINDIWLVNPKRRTQLLADKLKTNFHENQKEGRKRPLVRAFFQTFKVEVIRGGVAAFVSCMLQVLVPYVVKYIIAFATEDYVAEELELPRPRMSRGIGLVIGVTVMQIFSSMGYNHFFYNGMMVGGQVRSALISMIFDKAMTISGRAKAGSTVEMELEPIPSDVKAGSDEEKKHLRAQLDKKRGKEVKEKGPEAWSNGRIVTLMSIDTSRIDRACGWFHMIWTTPLGLIMTIVLLLVNLSYSALVGLAMFFTATPVMAYIVKAMLKRRGKINKDTDERTSLMQEALQAIRFIKYYAWEDGFLAQLDAVRQREIRGIRYLLSHRNAAVSMGSTIPIFASMLTFITFSLTSHSLQPAAIFSSLALFNQLRLPLVLFPMVVGLISDALKSVERLEGFLLAEDSPEAGVDETLDGLALEIRDASFTWEQSTPQDPITGLAKDKKPGLKSRGEKPTTAAKETTMEEAGASSAASNARKSERPPFTLNDMNLRVKPNELIAVVGTVGSGKTSLLSAIAGEMRRISGSLKIKGRRAFCTQVAWIQNATIRDNITFGQEFIEEKYDRIVKACSLDHDLQILPHGSFTEIGERGINLSGGQKQRVSLARAIYFDADVVLLDDPLGAVDAHVGEHLMEQAICGLLKDKCRVLVTHQLHVVPRCDRIVIMDNGKAVACDTFEILMATNEMFQQMMANVNTTEKEKSEGVSEKDEGESLKKMITQKAAQKSLMKEEERPVHGIPRAVYLDYFRSTGSILIPPFVLLVLCAAQAANIMTNLWLAWWSDNHYGFSTGKYIGIYAALGVSQGVLLLGATLGFTVFATAASKAMLHRAVQRILWAPTSFFDTIPLGRIMNRFSKDVDVMDNNMSEAMRSAATTVTMMISIFALTISYYYYFAAALVPLLAVYLISAAFYHVSALEVKRHESVLRSAVYARFHEAIIGTATIRAYGVQAAVSQRLVQAIDDMDSAYFLTFANQRWIGVRLDVLGVIFIFVVGMLIVTAQVHVAPSISGLVLSYLVSITQMLLLAVRQVADAANNMNSVERVHEYATVIQEAPAETTGFKLPASWPARCHISFRDVEMRYREGLPLVLHGLSIEVRPGERLGIVGRTGAGKSSIMAALFRMVELAGGSIWIDDIDISTVGLRDLRSRMSIIPQDPTLFRGTVRSNLDPFGAHTDVELWSALHRAHLVGNNGAAGRADQNAEDAQDGRITLESAVETDGANFSVGQRQLMSLARALVRDAQIIVCDEATSAIDFESDSKVQAAMAEAFKGKTVLCIAHRLKTIISYDRVCVVDNGQVGELGTPLELFDQGGGFRAMCDQSQIARKEIDLAKRQENLAV